MNGQAKRPDDAMEHEVSGPDAENPPEDAETGGPARAAEAAGPEVDDAAAALAAAQAKADDNWQRYLRAAAEVENIRKRSARDVENAHKFALERLGKELLAVRDSLEMGLDASDSASVESLIEGSTATLKLLSTTMERFGISVIDPEGEPFDPESHEAISMQPSDEAEPGSVLVVVQKGYALNGRLLRPAMVIVAGD